MNNAIQILTAKSGDRPPSRLFISQSLKQKRQRGVEEDKKKKPTTHHPLAALADFFLTSHRA